MPTLEGGDRLLLCYPADEAFDCGVRTAVEDSAGSAPPTVEAVELRLHESYPEIASSSMGRTVPTARPTGRP